MVSGWFEPVALAHDEGGTAGMTLGCPDDFYAVRIGFVNTMTEPWTIAHLIGRASSSFNDYIRPTGEGAWQDFTFANGGFDDDRIPYRQDASRLIEVRPSAVAGQPSWTWTDWVPLHSTMPDPASGMRVLMLRALVSSNQTVCCSNGQLRTLLGRANLTHGYETFVGGLKFNFDMVSDPELEMPMSTQTWVDNNLLCGTPFSVVQFLTRNPSIVGITTGDSHAQGTATIEQFCGFLYRATTMLGAENLNKLPFGMVNCAVGGLKSDEFFERFKTLVPAVRPSYAVLPGWTFNDTTDGVHADMAAATAFLARLLNSAEFCEANGVLPIFLTPFPRNAAVMSQVQVQPWLWLRSALLDLRKTGAIVLDATAILGRQTDGVFDGTYLPSMTDDQAHPNDDGHQAIAEELRAIISALCAA